MFRWLNKKRGQNTAEYAILIGVIVAAAIAMQVYIRRGWQARVKDAVDFMKTADDDVGGNLFKYNQYEPYYLQTNLVTTQDGRTSDDLRLGGSTLRNSISDVTQRVGNQVFTNYMQAN